MTERLRNINDLRDSSQLYDKNPPKFMTVIVIVILVSIMATVVVADTNEKSEIIHGAGIIQSTDKSYVMSSISGEIEKIHVHSGQYVENGDNLITIGSIPIKAQLNMYTNLANYYWSILEGYILMLESIKGYDIGNDARAISSNQNPFNANSERFMYLIFEGFLDQMDQIRADDDHMLSENRQTSLDSTLMECERVIREYEPTYNQALFQKEYAEALVDQSTIKAKNNGIINFETTLNEGMAVSPGTLIFSISSALKNSNAVVRLQIPVAYRPYLSENNSVYMEVVGYPSATYGKLEGRITEISSDSSLDSNGNVWFVIVVAIDKTFLNEKTELVQVTNGMMVAASIVYEESSWLNWFLKGLGF